jgi:thiol-disulfide isomerase/thioredoxin
LTEAALRRSSDDGANLPTTQLGACHRCLSGTSGSGSGSGEARRDGDDRWLFFEAAASATWTATATGSAMLPLPLPGLRLLRLALALLLLLSTHWSTADDDLVAGGVAVFDISNATSVLHARGLTLILLHNQYCAGCQHLRQQMRAAAVLHAAAGGSSSVDTVSSGFAETDISQNPGLLQAFALHELPALRIHRSSDNLTWEYSGGLSPDEMAAHVRTLARAQTKLPRMLRNVADVDELAEAATHIALVAAGPGARDGRVSELLRRVAESDVVRALEPTGLAVGALVDADAAAQQVAHKPRRLRELESAVLQLTANSTASISSALTLVLLQRHECLRWFSWHGLSWPSAADLRSWIVAHAVKKPSLVQLTPHSLTANLLEKIRTGGPPTAMLVGFSSAGELREDGAARVALARAAVEYGDSIVFGYLDCDTWPELAHRLRGSRSEHDLMVIDTLTSTVLVERQAELLGRATAADMAGAGSISWSQLQDFVQRYLRGELARLSDLPFHDSLAHGNTRDAEGLIGTGWAGTGDAAHNSDHPLQIPAVGRLYAADFQSTSLRDSTVSAQGGNASVPTMVAFLLPWCGFSIQVEPLIEELAAVAAMADLPVNVMRYDVTATNPLPEDIASTL